MTVGGMNPVDGFRCVDSCAEYGNLTRSDSDAKYTEHDETLQTISLLQSRIIENCLTSLSVSRISLYPSLFLL